MKFGFGLLVMLLVTACTSTFHPPQREGNAIINFANASTNMFRFYENGNNCTELRTLLEVDNPYKKESKSLVVYADKRIALQANWMGDGKQCNIVFALTPQAGAAYFIKGAVTKDECRLLITDETGKNVFTDSTVNIQQMRYVQGWGVLNQCVPK